MRVLNINMRGGALFGPDGEIISFNDKGISAEIASEAYVKRLVNDIPGYSRYEGEVEEEPVKETPPVEANSAVEEPLVEEPVADASEKKTDDVPDDAPEPTVSALESAEEEEIEEVVEEEAVIIPKMPSKDADRQALIASINDVRVLAGMLEEEMKEPRRNTIRALQDRITVLSVSRDDLLQASIDASAK